MSYSTIAAVEAVPFIMFHLILLCLIVLFAALHFAIHNTRKGKLIDKIQGPKGYPLIGNAVDFLLHPVEVFYKSRRNISEFKKIHRLWIIQRAVINIYDPDDVEVLLSSVKYIEKSDIYRFLKPWLNDGLLLSKGSKWHTRRKILTPAFHFNILKQFCKVFEEQSKLLVDKLKHETDIGGTNIIPYITQFALNAVCETAMGSRLDQDEMKATSYKKAIHSLGAFLVRRLTRIWLHFDVIFNISEIGKQQNKLLNTLHTFTTDVIRLRRQTRSAKPIDVEVEELDADEDIYTSGKKKRLAMLDLMLDAEAVGKIDELGIREEVDTFMFEGHDTTSLAIIFTLMQLANNPKIQAKIVEEMDNIFGESNRQATIEDLHNMKYLECCIKESLRLYPSVPFISRFVTEDMQLKDFLIPANTVCHVHIFDLHRNPKFYPSPETFDPDRFLPENASGRHPFAYIPFSAGPRNCIGQKFAILEEKSVISALLRTFELEPITKPEDLIFQADLVLRTENPIFVRFKQRNKSNQ